MLRCFSVRSTVRALLFALLAVPAFAGCSSLGGVELGDDGPDRFPEEDDDGPSYPTTDPSTHGHDADDASSSSSDTSPAPPGTIGHGDTEGDSGSESGSESDSDDVGTSSGTTATTGEPAGPDDAETGGAESGSETSAGEDAGTDGACEGLRLPPCPPACGVYEAPPCGRACDVGVDDGYVCGDEYGAGMVCEGGLWVCLDPPKGPGACPMVCDPSAGA